jgi:hypothetical protein
MKLNFSLSAEAEARLLERARASGLTPDDFARRVVELAMAPQTNGSHATPSGEATKRIAKLHEWAGSVKTTGHPMDDSRGSIYVGRDE